MYFIGCNDADRLELSDIASLDVFSVDFVDSFSCVTALGFSVLGVLGALEDPKLANAPDPKPKAEDPPTLGDGRAPLFAEASVLKELPFPYDGVSFPNLFEEGKALGESIFEASFPVVDSDVASEGLVLLRIR